MKRIQLSVQFLLCLLSFSTFAQTDGVLIDYNLPQGTRENKAVFQVNSTEQGALLPRMLSTERGAINPPATAQGMIVYQTDAPEGYYYWDGTDWLYMASSDGAGFIENRTVTNNFGTGQAANFDIQGNGEMGGFLRVGGNVGIGTFNPIVKLDIFGTDAIRIPGGTTAQRPTGVAGYVRFNSDSKMLEYYDGTQWVPSNVGQTPIGTIVPFAGPNLPAGWLRCDGSTVSRTTYADLFAAIGTAWGSGNGSSTFHLPDLRGRFARGVDGGIGRDPDAGTRTASNAGGNSGANLGSVQTDATGSHTHGINDPGHTHTVDPANTSVSVTVASHTHTVDPPNTGTSSNGSHQHVLRTTNNNVNDYESQGYPANDNHQSLRTSDRPRDRNVAIDAVNAAGDHTHTVDIPQFNSGSTAPTASGSVDIPATGSSSNTTGITIQNSAGSSESRPENAYVHYIIKAQNTADLAIVSPNIPNGISGQTLRYDGSNWTANSTIFNNGTNVGIGTSNPSQSKFVVDGTISIPRAESYQFLESISGTFRASVASTNTNDAGVGFNALRFFVNANNTTPAMVIGGSTNNGNVGIGTTNPTAKLEVAGQVKLTGGAPGAGKVLTSDADGDATWQDVGVPSGAVMYFDLPACPTGWSELTAARGRYIVGLPSGGTLNATVGTALTNSENRATGLHSHPVDPPNTSTTTNGLHRHSLRYPGENDENQGYPASGFNAVWATDRTAGGYGNGAMSDDGNHSHTVDIGSFNSGSSGSVAGTNAPYLQLRVCKKN